MSLPVTVIDGSVGTTTAGQATGEFFAGTPGQAFYKMCIRDRLWVLTAVGAVLALTAQALYGAGG